MQTHPSKQTTTSSHFYIPNQERWWTKNFGVFWVGYPSLLELVFGFVLETFFVLRLETSVSYPGSHLAQLCWLRYDTIIGILSTHIHTYRSTSLYQSTGVRDRTVLSPTVLLLRLTDPHLTPVFQSFFSLHSNCLGSIALLPYLLLYHPISSLCSCVFVFGISTFLAVRFPLASDPITSLCLMNLLKPKPRPNQIHTFF